MTPTAELARWREHAEAWEAVARALGTTLANTASWVDHACLAGESAEQLRARLPDLRNTFRDTCDTCQVTP